MSSIHLLGIRHHGPGSSRSLLATLDNTRPDIVLVEGPPDAADVLHFVAHEGMVPPVALLLYVPESPQQAAFYPFAAYSPEWNAIRWAFDHQVPVRFMDLPQTHLLALRPQASEESGQPESLQEGVPAIPPATATPEPVDAAAPDSTDEGVGEGEPDLLAAAEAAAAVEQLKTWLELRGDPLKWIAEAAGYEDSERWWDDWVEHRQSSEGIFEAIQEMMTALRAEVERTFQVVQLDPLGAEIEAKREAWMRQAIRAAQKEGFENIAVVCGAWHVPALAEMPPAKADAALLKGLPKVKTVATWVPWTNGRLCFASGYGAGIESPGWYGHIWKHREDVATRWMSRVAALLREHDLDASPAQLIEAVRLADTLAALRGRPLPGLLELTESIQTTLLFGNDAPLRLIREKLIVGEILGEVPDEAPTVPLQTDLARLQKKLRLPPEASWRDLDLDLRKDTDRERSYLLNRLSLLGVGWGSRRGSNVQSQGTFRESWRVQWKPEFSVALIEAALWGNTVYDAAQNRARNRAEAATDLPKLTKLLDAVLLANLPEATRFLMGRLENAAALASDVAQLMEALPPLVNILRYGDVRKTGTAQVSHVVDGLVARISIGLPNASISLDDEAAAAMNGQIAAVQNSLSVLRREEHLRQWQHSLSLVADRAKHGLVAGKACRLLLDAGAMEGDEAAGRLSLALSQANEPAEAAHWIEGFLKGSGALLLHDERLWRVVDEWVSAINPEAFTPTLPLLRRTFATFTPPERRALGEKAREGVPTAVVAGDDLFDHARAARVLPVLRQILGVPAFSG